MTEIEYQKQRVMDAWKVFRDETKAYKKLIKGPPKFLRDGKAKRLRSDVLSSAKLYSTRFELVKDLLSEDSIGAEIGVQFGVFSRFLLDEIRPKELFLFDLVAKNINQTVLDDTRTKLFRGDSSTRLSETKDGYFDWIYIDGDHSREGAQKDTDVARHKIREGGILVFNDYTPWSIGQVMPYGVMTVVNDLVNEGYPIIGLALAPHGYFDVAVRYKQI